MARVLYHIFLVAFGSAVGGLLRWVVGIVSAAWFGVSFPWGTLIINLTGCLFLGWFGTLLGDRLMPNSEELRLLLAVGLCGAYTTFSTFEFETNKLFQKGDSFYAILYLGSSVFLGLLAIRIGALLARQPWRGP
jgi:CrcB protein